MRVEARTARRNKIGRHCRIRIFRCQCLGVGRYTIDQFLTRRAEVRAAGRTGIITVSRGRRPGMKIAGRCECLTDQFGADDLAVTLDQRTVRLMRKDHLRNTPDRERVENTKANGHDEYH